LSRICSHTPYTTRFRSCNSRVSIVALFAVAGGTHGARSGNCLLNRVMNPRASSLAVRGSGRNILPSAVARNVIRTNGLVLSQCRSEEHTYEIQSLRHLV